MRGHAAVDGIGEFEIIFAKSFDERGGVNSRRGAKRVMPDDRIVRRDFCVRGVRDFFAIFLKAGQVLFDKPHEAKIDEH